jgi:putative mRNA 3-end processing factor
VDETLRLIRAPARRLRRPAAAEDRARCVAAFVVRDNVRQRRAIERAYVEAIRAAHAHRHRRALLLPRPRFPAQPAPGGAARRAGAAAAAGQDRLPHRRAGRARAVRRTARHGVRIYEYTPAFLHAKVAVVDDDWATVGSSNIDPLSLLLNLEANVVVRDPGFASTLAERFDAAFAVSTEVTGHAGMRAAGAAGCSGPWWPGRRRCLPAAGRHHRPLLTAADRPCCATTGCLYCPAGDFWIDPWRPVPRAICPCRPRAAWPTWASAGVLRARLGAINLQGLAYGEIVSVGGVRISLHPAGHVLGSAQVRLEHGGQVWVASGDYFLSGHADDHNPTCTPFEPVRCHCFITESTFGLPVYRWRPQAEVLAEVNAWWQANADAGRASLLLAYSFGKAQRLLAGVDAAIGPIVVHGAVRAAERRLPRGRRGAAAHAARRAGGRTLAAPARPGGGPAGRAGQRLGARLGDCSDAFASGWMQLRGARRRQGLDRGFVLSDHADWPGLQAAIAATGAATAVMVRVRHRHPRPSVRGGDGALGCAAGPAGRLSTNTRFRRAVHAPGR